MDCMAEQTTSMGIIYPMVGERVALMGQEENQ